MQDHVWTWGFQGNAWKGLSRGETTADCGDQIFFVGVIGI